MKLKPRNDQVLVKKIEDEETGLIKTPDSAKDKPQKGTVNGIGALVLDLKEGDTVLFRKYAGDEFPADTTLILMSQEDIIAIITEA